MKFAIAVTPLQYLYGIIGIVLFALVFMGWDLISQKTTPEEQKYSIRITPIINSYNTLNNMVSERSTKNKQALVKAYLPSIKITPNDWRLKGMGKFTIKNVTDVNVKAVRFTLILKSQSLGTNTLNLQPIKNFDKPLKPNQETSFDISFNSLALTSLQYKKGKAPAHVKDYVGTHIVSHIDVSIDDFVIDNPLPKFIALAPPKEDAAKVKNFEDSLKECTPYLKELVKRYNAKNRIVLSKKDFQQNRTCLNHIIASAPSLRSM